MWLYCDRIQNKNHLEIIDGTNGELFNLNNMEIKEILDELDKNIIRQEELSKNALESVINNNLLDKIIKKCLKIINF